MKFIAPRAISTKLTDGIKIPENQEVEIPDRIGARLVKAKLGKCLDPPPEIKAVPEEEDKPIGKSPAAKK